MGLCHFVEGVGHVADYPACLSAVDLHSHMTRAHCTDSTSDSLVGPDRETCSLIYTIFT